MSKKSQPNMVARPATVLTAYDAALIRRREIIKATIERLSTLEKKIKAKLDPKLDKELAGEKTAVVEVKGSAYRINHVNQDVPSYKALIEEFLESDMLQEMIGECDEHGKPLFIKENEWWTVKLLGLNKTVTQVTTEDLTA